jgi:hypothetical protein
MEPLSAMVLVFGNLTSKWYKVTVNESETITDAKPAGVRLWVWPLPLRVQVSGLAQSGAAKVERS